MTLWLLLAISIVSDPAGKVCAENDATNCRQEVKAGEVVPFDGQLLTPKKAATLAVKAGQCQERIDVERAEAAALVAVELSLERQLRENDRKAADEAERLLRAELERAHEAAGRSWSEAPVLWLGIGVVLTVAGIGLTAALMDATRPTVVTVP